MVKGGTMSMQEFDGWFSELVRVELGKMLAIMRARAMQKASWRRCWKCIISRFASDV